MKSIDNSRDIARRVSNNNDITSVKSMSDTSKEDFFATMYDKRRVLADNKMITSVTVSQTAP